MKVKSNRKSVIASIISESKIHTHEELASALIERGIDATQATLSRDIREIGALKGPDGCYMLPASKTVSDSKLLQNVECSGQFCVVHTKPGFASAFASMIDSAVIEGVMGTIAGDDTVLVLLRAGTEENPIVEKINKII